MSSTTDRQVILERMEKTNQVLEYADECRKTGSHTDVCLKTGTKSFPAHRLILSCYSMYFRTMFQTEMEEKYANAVEIEGVDATSLESLIDFIYTGSICINEENVCNLLAASDYLQIDEVKQFCFDFLYNMISVETSFRVLTMGDLYQNNDLINETLKFIANHFAQISTEDDFKCQSKANILNLLSQLNPDCVEQRLVYDAIIGWVKHKENRKDDFVELFQRLDLQKLPPSFLAETVSTETLVIESHLCSNLVLKALAIKCQKRIFNNPSKILSLGGLETSNKAFVVYNNDQKAYPGLPQESFGHCSLKVDNFVYYIGEEFCGSPTNKVWRMKLYEANTEWEEVSSMEVCRSYFGAAVYKNGIAVSGGWSQDAYKSAEFYDFLFDQWSALPTSNKSRHHHALVTCNDCLFCLGGYDGDKFLCSVEMLSDANETWQSVQPMQMPRVTFAAVDCMNTIYTIGGSNTQYRSMKSVEKYDFISHEWIYVKDMNIERRGHTACVMQNKIYVVGGKNTNSEFVTEIECYDPLSDIWWIVENTTEKSYHHAVVAV